MPKKHLTAVSFDSDIRAEVVGGRPHEQPIKHSTFDERLQPGQHLVPLRGNESEVLFDFINRLRIEFKQALATRVDTVHDFHPLQHSKMLGDCLPGKL